MQLTSEGERVKSQIERKFKVHSKLELQVMLLDTKIHYYNVYTIMPVTVPSFEKQK